MRDKHNARLGEQCVYFAENADFSAQKSVFYFKFMVVLEIGDIKSEDKESKEHNLKYGYIIEY